MIFVVATLTFVLLHAAPGEPFADALADPRTTPAMREALRVRFGLDRPLATQYVRFLGAIARGDFGISYRDGSPVARVLGEALPRTLLLMSTAIILGFGLGIVLGTLQGATAGSWFDRVSGGLGLVVAAIPDFWLALALLLLFAARWRLLPAGGMIDQVGHAGLSPAGRVLDVAKHLLMPAGTLALVAGAVVSRYQRAALLGVLPEPYIRSARARGLPRRAVVFRHALRNALLPTITLLGLAFPGFVGGAVFVEYIFSWPGIGMLAVDAVSSHDYPLALGAVMLSSVVVVVGSLLADVLAALADPRLRHA